MKKCTIHLAAMLVVAGSSFNVLAASDVVFERFSKTVDVNADGTFSQVDEILVRMGTEQGAKSVAQFPIAFSESLQTLDIVEAYTLRPDGTRLDVSADKVFTQASPIAINAPVFNDIKYKIIVFPEPLPNGKIYLRAKSTQKTAVLPNQFSQFEFPPVYPVDHYSFSLSAPADFALKTDSREMEGGKLADDAGRSRWQWRYGSSSERSAESAQLQGSDFGPYIAISSLTDWGQLAKAYQERAAVKAAVSPAVQTLADGITKDIVEPAQQTKALYQWVTRNVRYVGVFLGLGGFVPREASEILATRYGDCKDHAVLLEALLRAKGIAATGALINTQPSFTLPKVPVMGAFNHIITYVPSLDVFLDSTASFSRYAVLPVVDADKPVLLVSSGQLVWTPRSSSDGNLVKNQIRMAIKPDGSITGKTAILTTGEMESQLRARIAAVPAKDWSHFVRRWLGTSQNGSGVYTSTDPLDLEKPFAMTAYFDIKEAVSLQSPGAFAVPSGFVFSPIHSAIPNESGTVSRRSPFACASDDRLEDIELNLPEDIQVLAVPRNVIYKDKTLRFEATYRQEGPKILITRKLVRDRSHGHCDPSMWDEIQRMGAVIARDARAQVLIQ